MTFLSHNSFDRELKTLNKKYAVEKGLDSLKRLLDIQFFSDDGINPISPAKIHHLTDYNELKVWKVEFAVANLRPAQFPRLWFAVGDGVIYLLRIASHIDGYDDGVVQQSAIERLRSLVGR